jgi:hypothetical protein
MGQITQDLIVQRVAREDGYRELELSSFAVTELAKMLRNFKDQYYKRWDGELVGASRSAGSGPRSRNRELTGQGHLRP